MIYSENQTTLDMLDHPVPYIMEGQVVDTNDPDQMGRIRAWIPALDGENFTIEDLPWVNYAAPFGGFTVDYPAGGVPVKNESHSAYGFWAVPKVGSTVLIFCLNANSTARYYFAATLRKHRNRSLPAGRNTDFNGKQGPYGDVASADGSLFPIEPAYSNLREQFQNKLDSSIAKTRGAYERQVAQPKTEKDGKEGYQPNAADPSYLDPQTYCFVSPGRHALIMQDHPSTSRLRLKTAEGHQVIFDDANERIYVSTSRGKSWVEIDADGHIHVFGADSISMRSGGDINMFADGNINMQADKGVNISSVNSDVRITSGADYHLKATGSVYESACGTFNLNSESSLHLSSAGNLDLLTSASAAITASSSVNVSGDSVGVQGQRINLNSGSVRRAQEAACAQQASDPSIVPGHEPWKRPVSEHPRGPNWKE